MTRPGRVASLPLLPVLVGGGLFVVALALIAFAFVSNNSRSVQGVSCDTGEQLATHYHSHLDILLNGQPVNVPAQIGIQPTCFYWLHTHDTSGVIHIEAPKSQKNHTFVLGDFFQVWGQPISSAQVATIKLSRDQKLVAYVDGKLYSGDPAKIPLRSHENITLEITPPDIDPPPSFTWDPKQYAQ